MICEECPRRCGAERAETEGKGVCRMPLAPVLARAALHKWRAADLRHPWLRYDLFLRCSLSACSAKTRQISRDCFGRPVTMARLRRSAWS